MNKLSICLAIIAGRDEFNLNRLVKTINELTQMPNEIIIVFDMNQMAVSPKVNIDKCEVLSIEYLDDGKQPHMRNLAISKTSCDYIWFIDDDTSLESHSCENLFKVIEDCCEHHDIASFAGKIIENKVYDEKKLKKPIYFDTYKGPVGFFELNYDDFPFEKYDTYHGKSGLRYPRVDFCQGTSMVFNVEKLKSVGGFDEDLGIGYSSYEDSEPGFALSHNGYKTVYSPHFELIHHKLPRVGGVDRSNQQIQYNKFLVRNSTISLLKNNFPSSSSKYISSISFLFVQIARCIIENFKYKKSVFLPIKVFYHLSLGYLDGFFLVRKRNSKRINTYN